MTTVPLGVGAYKRTFGGEPEIRLVNRFLETNPTNLREKTALLARPGTNSLYTFTGTPFRGSYSTLGLFNGDLFVVAGANFWRYNPVQGATQITGIISGNGNPVVAWMQGIGYEYLFISDGLILQVYAGGTHASDVLTLSGGGITNQVIKIGATYYSWNAAVDTGAPTGLVGHPWLANPGSDPLLAMANLINFAGVAGVDFSTALPGPSAIVSATAPPPAATGTLTLSGGDITNQVIQIGNLWYSWDVNVEDNGPNGSDTQPYLALLGDTDAASFANMVKLLNFTGTPGIDYSLEVGEESAYVSATSDATHLYVTARTPGTAGNTILTAVFSGSFLAWGAGTLTGGGATATQVTVTARSEYTDGNAITATVVSGSFLSWASAMLTGGGVHALTRVVIPPIATEVPGVTADGANALSQVSSYVLVSVGGTQAFYWILPGEIVIDPLNFAEKESNPDNIVDMLCVGDQVLITGQGSTENWYASGNFEAPFVPIEGRVYARGTTAGTAVKVRDGIILVGEDGIVYSVGYTFGAQAQWGVTRISTHGIEERIRAQLRAEQGLTP